MMIANCKFRSLTFTFQFANIFLPVLESPLMIERRTGLLRAFDASSGDFIDDAAARFERGAGLAERDLQRLADLAERLVSDLTAWRLALAKLDVASEVELSCRRAGRILIESVFDEALTPPASRLLAAAFDLAVSES